MDHIPEITTLTRTDAPAVRQAVHGGELHDSPAGHRAGHPPLAAHEIPPGVELVTLPNGTRTLAYTQPAPPAAPAQAAPAQPVPRWAKTTALLAPTVGGGIAAGGFGLSYAAPGLIAVSHVLWAAVAFVAVTGLTLAAALRRRTQAPAHITQHIHASGLFGRANGTINQ